MPVQLPLRGLELPRVDHPAVQPADLWNFPHMPAASRQNNARAIGAAGEALVDSILLRQGLLPVPAPEFLPYDRLVIFGDTAFFLQIKTCALPIGGSYSFSLTKGYQRSPTGIQAYAPGDFDIAACVCLQDNAVFFMPSGVHSKTLNAADVAALKVHPRDSLEEALISVGLMPPMRDLPFAA